MANDTNALVERLSDMELAARDAERGFAPSYGDEDAATLREAIAALSRPLPGVVEGAEPSQQAIDDVAFQIWDESVAKTKFEPKCFARLLLKIAYAIDLAPRVATGYARGVEDAAKVAESLKTLRVWLPVHDDGTGEREHTTIHGVEIATAIRAILPKEPATEDATSETEHEP